MRRFSFLFLPLAFSACNSTPPEARFDPAEAAFIYKPGKTTIVGQAFLPDKTGHINVRFAAGETVRLIPATSHARARLDYYFRGAKFAPAFSIPDNNPDPDYVAHTRMPPGDYFISSQVVWKPEGAWLSEGGLIYEKVTVTGAETEPLRVIVSGK